ncbi:MAG: YbaY family lipoprotein [Kiritimatiellae bacterium]|nr:YbaY family lipoprotein [Kiritimatiellia bacterium]
MKILTGTVSCLQRIPVLATYELTIKLCYTEDLTGEVKVVAEKTITNFNNFPVEFSLEYNNALLKQESVYYMDAYVSSRGIKLLQADSKLEVLTRGARSVADIVLVRPEN